MNRTGSETEVAPEKPTPSQTAGPGLAASALSEAANPDNFVNCLARTLSAANQYLTMLLRDAGLVDLVPSHGEILIHLFACEPVTMQDLARSVHKDPSTMTALVRKLVEADYVSTRKSDADRRVTEVSLTAKGRSLKAAFERISSRLKGVQAKGIDADAFRTTCRTLDAIYNNFKKAVDDARTEGERS